jgi:succinoglycan biosynthesis transport protein ExoP
MAQGKLRQFTLGTFFRVVRRRKVLFLSVISAVLAVTVLLFLTSTRLYTASGTVQFQKAGAEGSGISDLISGSVGGGSDVMSANVDLQTQSKILQSDTLALTVIQDLGLESTPEYVPHHGMRQSLRGLLVKTHPEEPASVPLADSVYRRQRVLTIFEHGLTVRILAGTRLIEVEYTSTSPELAARIINRLVLALNDYTFQTKFKASSQVTSWLELQLGGLRKNSEDLQQRLVSAQKTTGLFGIGGNDQQGKSTVYSPDLDRLQQSTAELEQIQANLVLKGAIYQVVKTGDPELISQLSGANMNTGNGSGVTQTFSGLQSLRTEESTLQTQIAKDAAIFGPAFPRLIEERASLVRVQASIKAEIQRIAARAKSDYEIASAADANARKAFEENRAAAEKLNDRTIEYTLLKREADSSQMLYQDLLRRLKEAGIIESLRSSNITVVDPARIPADQSAPNLRYFLLFGVFGGLALASTLVYLRETSANTILAPDDIEEAGIPLVGSVPLASFKAKGGAGEGGAPEYPFELVSAPRGPFSESVRHLRSSLLISRSSAPPKIILVMSGSPKEGKSTLSVELAVSFAQMSSSVLLLEADMRRPVMRRRLGLTGTKGLSNILTNKAEEIEFYRYESVPGLSILPAGPVPPFSAELLGSQRMKDLLHTWEGQFDFIIIDCPPVLVVTDALMFAASADAILLVARSEQTTRSQLANTRKALAPFVDGPDKKIFGAVINAVSFETLKYYGYYGTSYANYYVEKEDA